MFNIHTVPNDIANKVQRWVAGTKIPWFYFNDTLGKDHSGAHEVEQDIYTIADMPRFTHYFYPNSKTPKEDNESVGILTDWILQNLLPNYQVMRLQGNMTTQLVDADKMLNIPHVDSANAMVTFLYYVNTSDGNTVFFKDKKIYQEVRPIKGTGVMFPSNTVHAGQVPCINKNRYVINMLFRKRD